MARHVSKTKTAHRQLEGGGFPVRRPIPTMGMAQLDPFLLLDEMGPVDWPPGGAIGAPDHPHRGFETITYVLAGEMEHRDSHGGGGIIGPGGVQWMTAGRGVIHSELPTPEFLASGGSMHGFQIWVNLPSAQKMMAPRYQHLPAADIPSASQDGVTAKVIAGNCLGVTAAVDTVVPITYLHLDLHADSKLTQPIPTGHNALVYVFAGAIAIGESRQRIEDGQLAQLSVTGDDVTLRGVDRNTSLLLLSGAPLGEPIARYGPFVMNTRAEIMEAIADFQAGRFAADAAT